ncbi:hypothetical protein PVAND_002784 [Polypedilum vanderplanki]|uniref:Tudor domain-containing protein n=1 Tax=Polypedilum vanderplanki TaxID=319348 RepID=A0A9J6BS18_POLVA|nr:hypothetical protein PVAND_002784 [Polypedilum vanderplanki]
MADLDFLKHSIRALLLSLGKCATEREFRSAWYETEGYNFNDKLKEYGMSFYTFFQQMPDVVKVHYDQGTNNVILSRVSGNAASAFMDKMTVQKYSKNYKGIKLKVGPNNVPIVVAGKPVFRPVYRLHQNFRPNVNYTVPRLMPTNRLSVNALPFRNNASISPAIVLPMCQKSNVTPQLVFSQRNFTGNNISNNYSTNSTRPQPMSSTSRSKNTNSIRSQPMLSTALSKTSTSRPIVPPVSSQTSIKNNTQTNTKSAKTSSRSTISKKALLKTLPPLRVFKTVKIYKAEESPPREAKEQSNSESLSTIPVSEMPTTSSIATLVSNKKNPDFDDSDAISTSTEYMSVKSMPVLENSESSTTLVGSSDNISQKNLNMTQSYKREAPIQLKNRLSTFRLLKQAINEIKTENHIQISHPVLNFSFESPNYNHGEKAFFKIKIIDVDSPDCFTFQFSLEKLEVLMEKLNRRYDSIKNLQYYAVKNIKIGMIVAVRNTNDRNRWYRAEIKEAHLEKLGIRFIDYLTVKNQIYKVLATDVYNLEQEFVKESSKSAYGRLHGLKPKHNTWCQNSKIELELIRNGNMSMMGNESMMATIKKIQNGIFSLSIIINQVDFIRISDYMVEQGYALVDFDEYLHLSSKNQRSLI